MVRILYVITKSNWGGAQKNVFDLATAMKNRGHEVMVALGGEGVLKQRLDEAGISTNTINGMRRDISVGADAGSLKQIFSVIRRFKPDVMHLHSPKAAGLGALAGRLLGVKNILVTVHGWTWNENRPIYQKASIVFFMWITSLLAHRTIVINDRDLKQGRRLPFTDKKIALIPLGIKPSSLYSVDGAKQTIAVRLGLSYADYAKRFAICTSAELHPNKGLTYLIRAMATVVRDEPQAIAVIMGDGEQRPGLSKLVGDLGLENNVFFLGYVEGASEYLKAFKLFVLPSIKEGLPYVLLEAGLAEVPVVASAVGGIPFLIEDGKDGVLVKPKDATDLAHAIRYCIDHEPEIRQHAAALRQKVTSQFSLDRMVEAVHDLYKIPQ